MAFSVFVAKVGALLFVDGGRKNDAKSDLLRRDTKLREFRRCRRAGATGLGGAGGRFTIPRPFADG